MGCRVVGSILEEILIFDIISIIAIYRLYYNSLRAIDCAILIDSLGAIWSIIIHFVANNSDKYKYNNGGDRDGK